MKIITTFKNINSFETQHLLARPINEHDLDKFIALHADPKVASTLTGVLTEEKISEILDVCIRHWEINGFGLWMFYLKTTNEWIGRGGLHKVIIDGNEEIDLAYAIIPKFWNHGFATEIAKASLEIAFKILHLEKIIAVALPTNIASQRVMQKVGMIYERKASYLEIPCLLYQSLNTE